MALGLGSRRIGKAKERTKLRFFCLASKRFAAKSPSNIRAVGTLTPEPAGRRVS